ncbi:MAG: hypothetical protein NTV36_00610 [Candidatus Staskawiczbacteria bacterium]|nr:hypothetical protein [Candidatus Staskawiczbacteria bacterium]
MELISKEKFLEEHNKLSPSNLRATLALLDQFKEEKKPLMKDDAWCLDKHRIPFISWLTALPKDDKKLGRKSTKKEIFRNYPETHYEG